MSQHTHRPRSVNPSEPSRDGEAREPDGPADTSIGPAALEAPAATPQTPDPFDVEALRLPQDFGAGLGVKKALLAIPVIKPAKDWWVRVHPSEEYRRPAGVIEKKGDRGQEIYFVAPALWSELSLATEPTFKFKLLATAINRQGTLFIWEVNYARRDGRTDEWSRTALEAVNMATAGWVRVAANLGAGFYDVFQASGSLPDPRWPDVPFRELLRIAFKDRLIESLDHPVLRELRGEV
jgi:hypothetical protein